MCSILIIISIVIAVFQFFQSQDNNEKRIAIEAITQTRSKDFIKAYTRLKTFCDHNQVSESIEIANELIDDYNYIMSIYEQIAILYNYDIVDKCVIKQIYSDLKEFSDIITFMKFKHTEQFDIFLNHMKHLKCN